MADLVMVVEVFISQRNADNPLHHQRLDRVLGVSGMRLSLKQAARRPVRPSTRSVAPSSNAPASLVMAPPSKDTTTGRPSAGANANRFGLHCVGIGDFLCLNVKPLSQKNFRSIRAPMHLTLVRDAGLEFFSLYQCSSPTGGGGAFANRGDLYIRPSLIRTSNPRFTGKSRPALRRR